MQIIHLANPNSPFSGAGQTYTSPTTLCAGRGAVTRFGPKRFRATRNAAIVTCTKCQAAIAAAAK